MNQFTLQVVAVWLSLLTLFANALAAWCVRDSIRQRCYGAVVCLVLFCGPLLVFEVHQLVALWSLALK